MTVKVYLSSLQRRVPLSAAHPWAAPPDSAERGGGGAGRLPRPAHRVRHARARAQPQEALQTPHPAEGSPQLR